MRVFHKAPKLSLVDLVLCGSSHFGQFIAKEVGQAGRSAILLFPDYPVLLRKKGLRSAAITLRVMAATAINSAWRLTLSPRLQNWPGFAR